MIRLTAITCCLVLSVASSLQAETKVGFRQITIVEPVAIQRGTTQEMTLRSNFTLDETYAVFFDQPGVTMRFLETEPKDAPRKGRGSDGTPFRFEVTAGSEALPGVRELRVATKQAVSSVSHLKVTDYPVFQEDEKQANNNRDEAVAVELPVAVCGRIEKAEDVDFYSFEGKAGQRVCIDLYAMRVTEGIHGMVVRGPLIYLMDGLLTLYGPNGQVIAQNDNFIGADAFLHVELPADGNYALEVRDARYAGSGRYVYCVELSSRPYAHAVYPLAVQRGQKTPARVVGHVPADATKTELVSFEDVPTGWQSQRLMTSAGETNPVRVLVSDSPQVVSSGNNVSIETAQALSLPTGVSGQFAEPDGVHFFSFEVKKDEWFSFEVASRSLGLPLDSILELWTVDGKRLTEADDGMQTKDSKLNWKATSDGTLCVSIRDLHGRGGDRFLYHLNVERAHPDFEVHGEYYYAQIAPGIGMMWFAKVNRLNGYDGPIEIFVENLPAGVTAEPVSIPSGMTHCGIILQAADDAPIDASLVRVGGRATVTGLDGEELEVVRYGRITCEQQGSGGGQARWPINTQIVGVTKPLDLLKVEATPNEISLKPGEAAEIAVRIERNEGFKDPVTLAMSFDYFSSKFGEQLPPGVKVGKASKLRLSGDVLEGKVVLEATDKAVPVERLPIAVLARVSITFSITTNYATNPVYLTVLPAE